MQERTFLAFFANSFQELRADAAEMIFQRTTATVKDFLKLAALALSQHQPLKLRYNATFLIRRISLRAAFRTLRCCTPFACHASNA